MASSTGEHESRSRTVADVLGGTLREESADDGVRRELVVEFPESEWEDVTDADVDELILEPVESET